MSKRGCRSKRKKNLKGGDRRRHVGRLVSFSLPRSDARWYFRVMAVMVEKISAITFRTANMKGSVQFYRDVLGMELLYGGEQASFSSLRAKDSQSTILNLEQGNMVTFLGRLIVHVGAVEALL